MLLAGPCALLTRRRGLHLLLEDADWRVAAQSVVQIHQKVEDSSWVAGWKRLRDGLQSFDHRTVLRELQRREPTVIAGSRNRQEATLLHAPVDGPS